ncbi:MAG: ATP-binding protein [Clostridium sp.]|nr:ATP-binding protein [Clostridium sp.]
MELEIGIEDILKKEKIESERIEFKEGWNPDDIYRSICAFANDYNFEGIGSVGGAFYRDPDNTG